MTDSAAFGLLLFVTSSDHFKERSIHTASSMSLAIVGLIVMCVSSNAKLRYAFAHICLAGAFTAGPLVVAWLTGNTPEKVAQLAVLRASICNPANSHQQGVRSIIVGINGYSNLAGVIAGQLYKSKHGPTCTVLLSETNQFNTNLHRQIPADDNNDPNCNRASRLPLYPCGIYDNQP